MKHINKINKQSGHKMMPSIDTDRYDHIENLEGPFRMESGKIVYYDSSEGKYYDRDSDIYLSDEEMNYHRNPEKQAESILHIKTSSYVQKIAESEEKNDDNPCWDGYKMVGTKKKNGKEVPNCVPEDES